MNFPNWSVEDKKTLLFSLREYGAHNMDMLQKKLPHKTVSEIRTACDIYSNKAQRKWGQSRQNESNEHPHIKLWMEIFERIRTAQKGSVHDVIPRVLKYIALFEKRVHSEHVDLKECYLFLSYLCSGMAPKNLDVTSYFFIQQCLLKLSKPIAKGENGKVRNYFKYLKKIGPVLNTHPPNLTSATGDHSAVLNPLFVPNHLLQRTELEKNQQLFY